MTVGNEELIQRLVDRAQVEGRTDDTEDVIRRRQQLYLEQTAPLVAIYRERGLLREVDGAGAVDEVSDRIVGLLESVGEGRRSTTPV